MSKGYHPNLFSIVISLRLLIHDGQLSRSITLLPLAFLARLELLIFLLGILRPGLGLIILLLILWHFWLIGPGNHLDQILLRPLPVVTEVPRHTYVGEYVGKVSYSISFNMCASALSNDSSCPSTIYVPAPVPVTVPVAGVMAS